MSFIISGVISNSDTDNSEPDNTNISCNVPLWNNSDAATLAYYSSHLDSLLQSVAIPYNALFDVSNVNSVYSSIDKFYNDICDCITKATSAVIPTRNRTVSDFNVPGWNTYVSEKHEIARDAYMVWLDLGKPRHGHYFDDMKKT